VSLDAGEVDSEFDKTWNQLSQRGGIKGFRPGKAPRSILKRHYDDEMIRAVTYDTLLQERFSQVCEDNELRPVGQPQMEVGPPPDEDEELADAIKDKAGVADEEADEPDEDAPEAEGDEEEAEDAVPLVEGKPFDFHVTFTVYPRCSLPEMSGLNLQRPVADIAHEMIDERLEQLREVNAVEVEVEREEVAEGDLVTADLVMVFEDSDEDEESDEGQEQDFVVGQRDYDPPIDREMIGHRVGDTVELEVDYPEDHPDEAIAGTTGTMRATIKSLKGRELPELDDEFAKSVGDYETLDALRDNIREQLVKDGEDYANEALRSQALEHLLEGVEVELPEEFVTDAAQHSAAGLMQEIQRSGMTVEDFAEAVGIDEETLAENQRARAASGLKLHFALEALIEQWEIEADEDDIATEMQRMADETGNSLMMVQQATQLQPGFGEELLERATRTKLIAAVVAKAEVTDVAREEYEANLGDDASVEEADEDDDEVAQAEQQEGDDN
jgi:trigger factor